MLFSEPKIPQPDNLSLDRLIHVVFQCSSASRKFLNLPASKDDALKLLGFSALQRAENSSTEQREAQERARAEVSVLFSEPKIPQPFDRQRCDLTIQRFQCSSASRKFLNLLEHMLLSISSMRFSALQRAENSSTSSTHRSQEPHCRFQCSSASRKFLNPGRQPARRRGVVRFSALQRAENSSTSSAVNQIANNANVSVLFSEPKIPQPVGGKYTVAPEINVSVLFSEPKIPQPTPSERPR